MTAGPPPSAGLSVFLVDDHAIVRSGVRAYLDLIDDITVAGEASNGQQALDRIAVLEPSGDLPDVVLMDLLMPGMDGIEATRQLKARWPVIEVVAVTSFLEEAKVRAALEAGAARLPAQRRRRQPGRHRHPGRSRRAMPPRPGRRQTASRHPARAPVRRQQPDHPRT